MLIQRRPVIHYQRIAKRITTHYYEHLDYMCISTIVEVDALPHAKKSGTSLQYNTCIVTVETVLGTMVHQGMRMLHSQPAMQHGQNVVQNRQDVRQVSTVVC